MACTVDPDPAALGLVQSQVHVLERAALLPLARLEGIVELVEQHALDQPQTLAQGIVLFIVRSRCQGILELAHLLPARPLLRGAERGHILPGLDAAQARVELIAKMLQLIDGAGGQQLVDLGQALRIGALARVDHVAEGLGAVRPDIEGRAEEVQIAEVLQPFLKVMACHDGVQIARLGLVGQILQLPEPAIVGLLIAREQLVEHLAGADAVDGAVQRLLLGSEGGQRRFVVLRRLGIGIELAVRVRHRQIGLLDGRIQQAAVAQFGPGRQGRLIVSEGGIRPPQTQQRLV